MTNKNHTPEHQERMDDLAKENEIPQDIQESWYGFCRSMQAQCSGNKGLAIITVEIGMMQTEPISWAIKQVEKVYPAKLADDIELSDKGIAALLAHMAK